MRLRAQLFLAGFGTALLFGVLGTWLLGEQTARSAEALLDGHLRTGEQALRRQWELRREGRRSVYGAISRQTFLRAYLGAGDRSQMSYFAQFTRQKGADIVAIVDREGAILAAEGPGAEKLAQRAARADIGASGELVAVNGRLLDAFRLPIGLDKTMGYLLAANLVTEESLRRDAEPFGVFATLCADSLTVSTLPSLETPSAVAFEAASSSELSELRRRYRTRLVPFGRSQLLICISLQQVHAFTNEFLRQVAAGFLIILVAIGVVSLILFERITGPIEKLNQAADSLGNGHLLRSRDLVEPYRGRRDEIGGMAQTLDAAAERLVSLVASCQNLVGELGQTVAATERSAADVAYGAVQQEKRLADMRSALGPMTSTLGQTSSQLGELRAITVNMALGLGMVDHAMSVFSSTLRSVESSALRPGASAAADSPLMRVHGEQHDALRRLRDQFAGLRRRLDEIVDVQSRGQHQGQFVHNATAEIGRVAKLHAEGAASLASSAERLRQEAVALNSLLSQLETVADPDDAG